jgi:hypothetical protein
MSGSALDKSLTDLLLDNFDQFESLLKLEDPLQEL